MHRRYKRLILFACFGVILILGCLLFLRSGYVLNQVRLVLASELQKRLKHPVTIDAISGNVFTGLNLRGIKIADVNPENSPLIALDEILDKIQIMEFGPKEIPYHSTAFLPAPS